MAKQPFSKNVAEIITIARSYVNARIELWKLTLLEKVSLAGAFFISSVIIVLIIAFCLLFISLAFAIWYGQRTGDFFTGFLILAGFYLILGLVFIISRKQVITGPVVKSLSNILYKDEDEKPANDDEKEKE